MATELTWQADVNHVFGAQSSDDLAGKWYVWYLTHQMIGTNTGGSGAFTQGLWTVHSCSDGVTVSPFDLWGTTFTPSKIVTPVVVPVPNTAHSWMVLTKTFGGGSGLTYYLTVDMNDPVSARPYFYISKSEPTGGMTTARPTATDEVRLFDPTTPLTTPHRSIDPVVSANDNTKFVHMMMSTRGDVWLYANQTGATNFYSVFALTELADTRAGDTFPLCGTYIGDNTVNTYFYPSGSGSSIYWSNSPSDAVSRFGFYGRTSNNAEMARVVPGFVAQMTGDSRPHAVLQYLTTGANGITGQFAEFPLYATSSYPANRALYPEVRGRFADFQSASASLANFTTRTSEYVKVGDTWVPWASSQTPFR